MSKKNVKKIEKSNLDFEGNTEKIETWIKQHSDKEIQLIKVNNHLVLATAEGLNKHFKLINGTWN